MEVEHGIQLCDYNTELYYGIVLQDYITDLFYGIILQNYITELHCRIVLGNRTMGLYHRIIWRSHPYARVPGVPQGVPGDPWVLQGPGHAPRDLGGPQRTTKTATSGHMYSARSSRLLHPNPCCNASFGGHPWIVLSCILQKRSSCWSPSPEIAHWIYPNGLTTGTPVRHE